MPYSPSTERWRALVAEYFPPELVDKALYVIEHESGGNPSAAGDGGAARGLFQIQDSRMFSNRPDAAWLGDPENNIRYAAQTLGAASGNWAPWGENNSYNGQPFGALGNNPYPGTTRMGGGGSAPPEWSFMGEIEGEGAEYRRPAQSPTTARRIGDTGSPQYGGNPFEDPGSDRVTYGPPFQDSRGDWWQLGSNGRYELISRADGGPTDRAPQLTDLGGVPTVWDPDDPYNPRPLPGYGASGPDADGDGYDDKTGFPVGVTSFGGKLYYRGQEVNPDGSPKGPGQAEAPDLVKIGDRYVMWDAKSGTFIDAPIAGASGAQPYTGSFAPAGGGGSGGGDVASLARMLFAAQAGSQVSRARSGASAEIEPMSEYQRAQLDMAREQMAFQRGESALDRAFRQEQAAAEAAARAQDRAMQDQIAKRGEHTNMRAIANQAANAYKDAISTTDPAAFDAFMAAGGDADPWDMSIANSLAIPGNHAVSQEAMTPAAKLLANSRNANARADQLQGQLGGDVVPMYAGGTPETRRAARMGLRRDFRQDARQDFRRASPGMDYTNQMGRVDAREAARRAARIVGRRGVPAYATGTPQQGQKRGLLRRPSPFDRRQDTVQDAGVAPSWQEPPSSPGNVALGRELSQKQPGGQGGPGISTGAGRTSPPGPVAKTQGGWDMDSFRPGEQANVMAEPVTQPATQPAARISPADQLRMLEASGRVRGSGAAPPPGYSLLNIPAGDTSGQQQGRTALVDGSGRTVFDPYRSLKQGPGREVTLEDMVRQYEQQQARDQFFAGGNEWNDLGMDFDSWREMKGTAERLGIDTNRRDWYEPWAAADMEYGDWQKMGTPSANWMKANPTGSIEDWIQGNADGSWDATADNWGMNYPRANDGVPIESPLDRPDATYTDPTGREFSWTPVHGSRSNPNLISDWQLMAQMPGAPAPMPPPTSPMGGGPMPAAASSDARFGGHIDPATGRWSAYAQGTKGGHPGGPAVVGDSIDRRPNPEMVMEPGREPYMVTRPQMMPDMPRGTEVMPLRADMRQKGRMGLQRQMMPGPRAYAFGTSPKDGSALYARQYGLSGTNRRLSGGAGGGYTRMETAPGNTTNLPLSMIPLTYDASPDQIAKERKRRTPVAQTPAPAPPPAPAPVPPPAPGGGTNTGGGGGGGTGGGTNTGGGGGGGPVVYENWEDLLGEVWDTRTGADFRDLWGDFYDPRYEQVSPTIRDRFEKGYQGKFGIPQEDLQAEGYRLRPRGLTRSRMAIGR